MPDKYILDEAQMVAADYMPSAAPSKLRALPDGALAVGDFFASLVMRGMAYHVSIGAFSTPITGGGNGTVLDLDQPEGCISVPAGWAMIPLRVHVQCQVPLLAADSEEAEILVAVDRAAANAKDGTFTTEAAYNMRTNFGDSAPFFCGSAYTADTTDPVLDIELARRVLLGDVQGTAANAMWTPLELLYEPLRPPILVGPCAMYLYWGGTVAVTGFAQVEFAAIRAEKLTTLV